MEVSKTFLLYNALINRNKSSLLLYIKSNFVRFHSDVQKTFQLLAVDACAKDKQSLHNHLYPDTPYNDLRIRHVLSLCNQELERFLIQEALGNNKKMQQQLLAKQYAVYGLEDLALKHISQRGKMEDSNKQNAAHFFYQYDLGSLYYDLQSENERSKDFDFQETIDALTAYTLIESLKIACKAHAIQKVTEKNFNCPLTLWSCETLSASPFLDIPMVRIYYNLYQLQTAGDEYLVNDLLQDLRTHGQSFAIQDLNVIYRALINFCIKKSNQNRTEFTQLTFELYIYAIDKGILIERKEINRFIFTNIITLGTKLKAFSKTIEFLENFGQLLNVEYRATTIHYNLARILYAQGELDNALRILLTTKLDDKLWNLNAKFLCLKILFEKQEMDIFKSHLQAFKLYVSRAQSIGYHKEYFSQIAQSMTQLYKMATKPKKHGVLNLEESIPGYQWFADMAKNLTAIKKL